MDPTQSTEAKIKNFLEDKHLYQLGILSTEQGHPLTSELSSLANNHLLKGLEVLKQVDIMALEKLKFYSEGIVDLAQCIRQTIQSQGKVFLCGCGATGRLSISLERIWREIYETSKENIVGFMAGGDVAFVHAIEGFEDYPKYGVKQLEDLGFTSKDLFVGITEGGETPFVIGATEYAAGISAQKAFFIFCNPEDLLKSHVARSKKILETENVQGLCWEVGPMALAGSTRMQASTVLMFGVGLALFHHLESPQQVYDLIDVLIEAYDKIDLQNLVGFVESEADTYKSGDRTIYRADEYSATVFTDTTERAPTFSLAAFDNNDHPQKISSLSYVSIPGTHTSKEAWEKLFLRLPRTLEWSQNFNKATSSYMSGFDFSENAIKYRENLLHDCHHFIFSIEKGVQGVTFSFRNSIVCFRTSQNVLMQNILLKMILNMHSTLVMGRLHRYEGHFMTYVKPSNGKLIDRATRYVLRLLEKNGIKNVDYDKVVRRLLTIQSQISQDEPVVMKTVESYLATSRA